MRARARVRLRVGVEELIVVLNIHEGLYLHKYLLSGMLPTELGSLRNLQPLHLHETAPQGALPAELGSLCSLQGLVVGEDSLSGTLPEAGFEQHCRPTGVET